MGRFNLLSEPWIRVVTDSKGKMQEVSMLELFENAQKYLRLAGETEAQNFAMLRLLLAVLHTVFSRLDVNGKPYAGVNLDERFKPISEKISSGHDDYYRDLETTWYSLWELGAFPDIVRDYLQKWTDHFYLFDEEFPFYQVSAQDLVELKPQNFKKDNFAGKNLNRNISESGNKVALFSPKYANHGNKSKLTEAQIARWLVALQGYIGVSDKAFFANTTDTAKGWLYNLGGLYVEGESLFESLMLNFIPIHEESLGLDYIPQQHPCWELSGVDFVNRRFASKIVDNLAELYTVWGRAAFIDPHTDVFKPFSMGIIKLPELNLQDAFIEPMTLWRWNDKGAYKGSYTPSNHIPNQALWRSFNVIALKGEKYHRPGIMLWIEHIEDRISLPVITLQSVGLVEHSIKASKIPIDDISDYLQIADQLLFDQDTERWTIRIDAEVQLIKKLIEWHLKSFANHLNTIRNSKNAGFVDGVVQKAYFAIDQPFRNWLVSIDPTDSPEEKIRDWRGQLFAVLKDQADELVKNASKRDYLGRVIKKKESDQGKELNIAIAYSYFMHHLKKGVAGE